MHYNVVKYLSVWIVPLELCSLLQSFSILGIARVIYQVEYRLCVLGVTFSTNILVCGMREEQRRLVGRARKVQPKLGELFRAD
jgi:hypothetical protein